MQMSDVTMLLHAVKISEFTPPPPCCIFLRNPMYSSELIMYSTYLLMIFAAFASQWFCFTASHYASLQVCWPIKNNFHSLCCLYFI